MNKKKIIILSAVGVVILVGIVLVGLLYVKVYANPYNRTAVAIGKSMMHKSIDMTAKMSFTMDSKKYGENFGEESTGQFFKILLEKMSFEERVMQQVNYKDLLKSKTQFSANVIYDNEILVDLVANMDQDELQVMTPGLLDKTFFITMEDLFDELDVDYEDIDLERYRDILKDNVKLWRKVDWKNYNDILKDTFEDEIKAGDSVKVELAEGKSVKCKEYSVEISYSDIIEAVSDIQDELADDEDFREYVRVAGLAILEEMEDSKDYKLLDIDREAIKEAIDALEDEDDFEDVYEESMSELKSSLDVMNDSLEQSGMDLDYEIIYAIDMWNNIRSMRTSMDYEFVKMEYELTVNSVNKKLDFKSYKDNERVDIMDMKDYNDEEMQALIKDYIVQSSGKIVDNKALDNLLRDMQKNGSLLDEYDQEAMNEMIDRFLQDKDSGVDIILEDIFGFSTDTW